MAAGMFLFAIVDTQAKILTDTLHPIQIVWTRQLGLLIGVLLILLFRGTSILQTQHLALQISRGFLAAGSAILFVFAITYVPLADAVAITFVAPFMVTIMGALILKEPVGIRRWIAVAIGFAGTLIVVRPGLGVIHPAALLIIVAAGLFASRQILSRFLSSSDRTITTICYTALGSSLILTLPLPFIWQSPTTTTEFTLLVSIAILAALAECLVIKSLEIAQAVALAPVHYSLMIWGTLYGYLIFNQLPDLWTWIGALIIIITGIYTIHRERQADKRRLSEAS